MRTQSFVRTLLPRHMFRTLAACAFVVSPCAVAQTPGRVSLDVALNAPATILLEDIRLGDAIEKIAAATGVPVVIPMDVLDLAPYGRETVVERVEMRDVSLRRGLMDLLSPLGMTFHVRGDRVEVAPLDALQCLGRPATWGELDLLVRIRKSMPGIEAAQLEGLRSLIQFQTDAADPWAHLVAAIQAHGAGDGLEALSHACEELGWGWCLDGSRIVVSSRDAIMRERLSRHVTMKISNRPLIEALQALGAQADVPIRVEPGAFRGLSLQVRHNFSLFAVEIPAEQVLEQLAATTGLGYAVGPDGVLIFRVEGESPIQDATSTSMPVAGADPYVAKIVVPLKDGQHVEWLIRESELPADLRGMRRNDLQKAFDAIRTRDGIK